MANLSNRILFVGVGQAGCNCVDSILSKNKKYVGLFINTTVKDIELLDNFDLDTNCMIIPAVDGTGKDRSKSKELAKKHLSNIVGVIGKYVKQDVIYLMFSAGGGSGSGLTPLLIKGIKRAYPNKFIHAYMILPKSSEQEIELKNTTEAWNEIVSVLNLEPDENGNEAEDALTLIDNDSMEEILDINETLAIDIDAAINTPSSNIKHTLDDSDVARGLFAPGYQMTALLNTDCEHPSNVVSSAFQNSIYVKPENYECDYAICSTEEGIYEPSEIANALETVYQNTYKGYNNNEQNVLVLSGLLTPVNCMDKITEALKDIQERRANRKRNGSLFVEVKDSKTKVNTAANKKKTKVKPVKEKDLDDLFDDSFFD